MLRNLLPLSLFLASGGTVWAEDAKPVPYPLDTCIVSGEALGSMGDAVVKIHDGREVKFCCAGCIKKFDKDPAKYIAAADAKAVAEQDLQDYYAKNPDRFKQPEQVRVPEQQQARVREFRRGM